MRRSTPFALAALALAALGAPTAGLGASQPRCTITAPARERVVVGTPRADVICATRGAHVVRGGGGNDTILTGSGADVVYGGTGDDTIRTGGGGDVLAGDAGDDQLLGGTGDDTLDGGPGDDDLDPGPGHNHCTLGAGSDRIGLWCDAEAPHLESLTLSTDRIDTSQGPASILVTAHITDDLAGLRQGVLQFGDVMPAAAIFEAGTRVSGTPQDGVYEFTAVVPRYTRQGTFRLSVYLADTQDNHVTVSSDDLAAAALPAAVEQTGEGDTAPPELLSVSLDAPASVDTSRTAQMVYADLHITDAPAGLMHGFVRLTNPLTTRPVVGSVNSLSLVSGDAGDGVYHVEIRMNPDTIRGTWTLSSVELWDRTYHHSAFDAGAVAARASGGLAVEQTGVPETNPPVLSSVSFSPDTVDESADFTIMMTVEASDADTGIAQVDCNLYPPGGGPGWLAFAAMPGFPTNIVSGDAYAGTFRSGVVTAAESLKPGVWWGTCFAVDWAGNRSPSFAAPPITIA
jgi:hypothetical protein